MFWCLQLLTLHSITINALLITLPDTVVLKASTTINYVTESSDPSQWILRNVYGNGTTQIGGTLSGTSSTSFTFTVTGPHFLQALALTNGTAASAPFYTGNLFTPIDLSAPSSSSQIPISTATQTVISSSCPSSATALNPTTETTNDTGTIVGSVIGGLGFLAALVFFLLWFNLRGEYSRLTQVAPSTLQMHHTPSSIPLMASSATSFILQNAQHHAPTSSLSDIAPAMASPISSQTPLSPQRRQTKLVVVNQDRSTSTYNYNHDPSLDMSETSNNSASSQRRGRGEQSRGALRSEVSQLRRELEEIRQAQSYNVPPPTY
ncbi:hypothetical protein J3R30DRAFT_3875695 [Lentinula aciculospora]|uniref:Transmembrane protein n=1 Tax=Lentinula aciculospora TaxID=153920 RepID=A0A9W9AE88_9AGAR|nr:hypothetical protein J3R30DRAFT_3875695 [Lentinula aciculospora]